MWTLVAFALVPWLALAAGGKKSKEPTTPRVEVLELSVKRTTEGTVEVDGTIRNCGDKPIHDLVLRFKVLSPDGEVLTTQKGEISPEVLDAGEEAEFHWKMRDHARAVALRVEATDRSDSLLAVAKSGPYMIE
jgi:thioredoxin reductase